MTIMESWDDDGEARLTACCIGMAFFSSNIPSISLALTYCIGRHQIQKPQMEICSLT